MYRDILQSAASVLSVARRIAKARPDILLLLDVDYDADLLAAHALAEQITTVGGPQYPYLFARPPNSGLFTGHDMDGDGRLSEPEDAQGFGAFAGQGGMVLLSRHPIRAADARDFSIVLWQDLPWATLPQVAGAPFPSADALQVQRLSTTGHWAVSIDLPGQSTMTVLVFHATPPAFDGPEDRNGLRNADEIRFWQHVLTDDPMIGPAILAGGANLDPLQGDGHRTAIQDLLGHPTLQDPFADQPAADRNTVNWTDLDLGLMRTDYVLPTRDFQVVQAGVDWGDPADKSASRHGLVWVDVLVAP